jgi:hypothetical protein
MRKSLAFQREGSPWTLNPAFISKGILSSTPLKAERLSNGVNRTLRGTHPAQENDRS